MFWARLISQAVGLDSALDFFAPSRFSAAVVVVRCGAPEVAPESFGAGGEVVVMVPDVDAYAEQLRAAGVPVLSGPADRPWGHRTVHVADPDGFVVEFAEEIPRTRGRL